MIAKHETHHSAFIWLFNSAHRALFLESSKLCHIIENVYIDTYIKRKIEKKRSKELYKSVNISLLERREIFVILNRSYVFILNIFLYNTITH